MRRFIAIWAGQLISQLGSAATTFALAVWMYRQTGAIAHLAAIAAAAYLPHIVVAPYGGVLADRLDRRRLLLAADAGSALATAALLGCAAGGVLAPASAVALVAASASCNALQWPAYEAAVVTLVARDQLGRASGLVELSRGMSQLLAPVLAGALYGAIGLRGVVLVDLASFAVGVLPLLLLRLPAPPASPPRPEARRAAGWVADLADAWRLIRRWPGLVAMLVLFSITNFTFAVVELLLKPLILSAGAPWQLGVVLSSVGVGMVAGSLALSAWGAPRRRISGILWFQLVEGGSLVVAGARPTFGVLCVAAFAYGVVIPLTFGCARTIWQVKVPHALQGRVAALRNAIVMLAIPVGYAAATPLSALAGGPAPVVVAMGALTVASAVAVFAFAPYRRVEAEIPDALAGLEGTGP